MHNVAYPIRFHSTIEIAYTVEKVFRIDLCHRHFYYYHNILYINNVFAVVTLQIASMLPPFANISSAITVANILKMDLLNSFLIIQSFLVFVHNYAIREDIWFRSFWCHIYHKILLFSQARSPRTPDHYEKLRVDWDCYVYFLKTIQRQWLVLCHIKVSRKCRNDLHQSDC